MRLAVCAHRPTPRFFAAGSPSRALSTAVACEHDSLSRQVILATNVAETSLTLPGVRVVIDTGLVKEKTFEASRSMEILSVVPISRSAAVQRAGRAGRTAPGEVYRLYTEAQLARMAAEPLPEIARIHLSSVVLQVKAMGLRDVLSLDWLDPPQGESLRHAATSLHLLGALDDDGDLTRDGRAMAKLPLEPALARVLLTATALGVASQAAMICAMACGEEPFHRSGRPELLDAAAAARERLDGPEGDFVTLLHLQEEWRATPPRQRDDWCASNGVRARVMRAADDVHTQLLTLLRSVAPRAASTSGDEPLAHPAAKGPTERLGRGAISERCRRALAEAYFVNAARKMRGTDLYQTLATPPQSVALRAGGTGGHASGPASAGGSARLRGTEYIVFDELVRAGGRAVVLRACAVDHAWLAPMLPRAHAGRVDAERLLRGAPLHAGAKRAAESSAEPSADAVAPTASADNPAERRNDSRAVLAAQERYRQRQRQRT